MRQAPDGRIYVGSYLDCRRVNENGERTYDIYGMDGSLMGRFPEGQKIQLIKEIRAIWGCGLREAKDYADEMYRSGRPQETRDTVVFNPDGEPMGQMEDLEKRIMALEEKMNLLMAGIAYRRG